MPKPLLCHLQVDSRAQCRRQMANRGRCWWGGGGGLWAWGGPHCRRLWMLALHAPRPIIACGQTALYNHERLLANTSVDVHKLYMASWVASSS